MLARHTGSAQAVSATGGSFASWWGERWSMGPGPGARGEFVTGASRDRDGDDAQRAITGARFEPGRIEHTPYARHARAGHPAGDWRAVHHRKSAIAPETLPSPAPLPVDRQSGLRARSARGPRVDSRRARAAGGRLAKRQPGGGVSDRGTPGPLDGAPPPPAPDPSHAFSPHSRAARPPARRSAPPQSATWPPAGSSGSPAATQSSRPPSMLWASKPAPRRASAAIAERAPLRQ